MAFIIEDGTGKADSNSYVSVDEFKSYWTDRGTTFTEADSVIQTWLILGTQYLDNNYNFHCNILVDTQALKFPRTPFYKCNGVYVPEGTIPAEVKKAVYLLANYSQGNDLDEIVSGGISSKSVGSVSVSYRSSSSEIKKIYTSVNKALSCIVLQAGYGVSRT